MPIELLQFIAAHITRKNKKLRHASGVLVDGAEVAAPLFRVSARDHEWNATGPKELTAPVSQYCALDVLGVDRRLRPRGYAATDQNFDHVD